MGIWDSGFLEVALFSNERSDERVVVFEKRGGLD
jgi:hypothetical protein